MKWGNLHKIWSYISGKKTRGDHLYVTEDQPQLSGHLSVLLSGSSPHQYPLLCSLILYPTESNCILGSKNINTDSLQGKNILNSFPLLVLSFLGTICNMEWLLRLCGTPRGIVTHPWGLWGLLRPSWFIPSVLHYLVFFNVLHCNTSLGKRWSVVGS